MTKEFKDPPIGGGVSVDGAIIKPGKWTPNELGLPSESECPVEVLGVDVDGVWVLDANGFVRHVEVNGFSRSVIQSLFGVRQRWLYWAFPSLKKAGADEYGNDRYVVAGWRVDAVREALLSAAARRGRWLPVDQLRGRGLWSDDRGGLLIHCGDRILRGGEVWNPGLIDGALYLEYAAVPPAPDEDVGPEVGRSLLDALRCVSWSEAGGPIHMLGMIGAMLVCGALPWRPHLFVSGERGSGRSTLCRLVADVLGPLCVHAEDLTPAGLRQDIAYEARPVVIDAMGVDGDAVREMIKFARFASAGQPILRGGTRHEPDVFRLRSCFMISSIHPPSFEEDGARRFLHLALLPSSPELAHATIAGLDLPSIGPRLQRRIVDRWGQFMADYERLRLDLYTGDRDAAEAATLAVIAALAGILLSDDPNTRVL